MTLTTVKKTPPYNGQNIETSQIPAKMSLSSDPVKRDHEQSEDHDLLGRE